jgi:co-chaperonin GroES (HSP10)
MIDEIETKAKAWPKPDEIGLKVCGDRILVLPDELAEETAGGILLVNDKLAKLNIRSGRLVKVGNLAWNDHAEPYAEVGDRVIYGKYCGSEIECPWTGKLFRMMVDQDINAVILDKEG